MPEITQEEIAKVNSLKRKQEVFRSRLLRISSFVDEFNPNQNISLVKARLEVARDAFKEFNKLHDEIEDNIPVADLDAENDERLIFEELYFNTISKIDSLLEANEMSKLTNQNNQGAVVNSSNKDRIKLPTISLPEFSGSFEKWLPFRDSFVKLIHSNESLSDIEKMHYLRSTVTGDALCTIEGLSLSDANYSAAWSLLVQRFENQRLLIGTHVRKIVNWPAITKTTAALLRQLIIDTKSSLEALKSLNEPVEHWDSVLVTIISDKLDYQTKREWQKTLSNEKVPFSYLMQFLESQCQFHESAGFSNNKTSNQSTTQRPQVKMTNKGQTVANVSTKGFTCAFCKRNNHFIHQCTNFLKLSVADRISQVQTLKLCNNCLRNNHETNQCNSKSTCKTCKAAHNSLLHVEQINQFTNVNSVPSTSNNHCGHQPDKYFECLLSTAEVLISDNKGKIHTCRALIDNGSQSHFITKNLCKKLNLQTNVVEHVIRGINQSQSKITEMAEVVISSKYKGYTVKIDCLVLEKITNNLPRTSFGAGNLKIPSNIALADVNFNVSGPIDLLLGAQIFFELLRTGKVQLGPHLYLQNTHFGWIAAGDINIPSTASNFTTCNLSVKGQEELQHLNRQINKFWDIESYGYDQPVSNPLTKAEQFCEDHFLETTQRTDGGRFMVKLPIKNYSMNLGNSYNTARQRFLNLERKFNKNPQLSADYKQFIREYQSLGHMELIPHNSVNNNNVYYLPHHAVFKECSTTTKIRVVFDGSAKSSNNKSLNDHLLVGAKLQQDLISILTRFRTFQYVLNADITKMYRQIQIHPEHADYQRIIWRDNPNEPLQIYRLTTVTYGTTSAPFLAIRCLQQLAHENKEGDPHTSQVILRDFYVDDLLTGSNSVEELVLLRDNLIKILRSAGFELAKWASNNSKCLPDTSQIQSNNPQTINLDKHAETKTLGLSWNCSEDILKYKLNSIQIPEKLTKRNMLSVISTIFDPLGLVSPVIVKAKVILQQLWSIQNLGWDQQVPNDLRIAWVQLIHDLPNINQIQIPRNILRPNVKTIELHGFADASEKAYGAAIYLKSTNQQGDAQIHLLISKSRVAPLKSQSIPRLELLAAQLLAQLTNRTLKTLDLTISKKYFWTDSTIVLAWLSQESNLWQTFVANRVAEIQTLTDFNDWNHICSSDNPADIISRGSFASQLQDNDLWWHGPTWLRTTPQYWPTIKNSKISTEEIPEKRKITNVHVAVRQEPEVINKISNFTKLKRIMAYVKRFTRNCRNLNKQTGPLSTAELNDANNSIMKLVQQNTWSPELRSLTAGRAIKNSPLASLDPFIDDHGVMRVGGRLHNSRANYEQKHPILLPKIHHVTEIIIQHFHTNNLHAGAQATLSAIRQFYWPIGGISKVKQILHKCIKCFRARPTIINQKMGNLPIERVEPARPFIKTGIDYCGPISIKEGRGRGKRTTKGYICLFVCLSMHQGSSSRISN
jgi:hypothetical protein